MGLTIIETNLDFASLSYRSTTSRIILHHAEAFVCNAATIHQWHKNNGWAGIGYHFLIRKNGTIERGRPENTIGAHASGSNSNSIGICFEGSYMTETMSRTQIDAGKQLISYLKNKYGISKVQAHRDVCSTNCPGTNFPFAEISGVPAGDMSINTSGSSTSYNVQDCLGNGDRGTDVSELQTMLISCGFSCGQYGADGVFGAGTTSAVKKFQSTYGLNVDGLAGKDTMAKLRGLYSGTATVSNSGNWYARLQSECNAQGFSNQKVDGISGKNTLAGCPQIKLGAKGNITKLAQEKFIALGYSCGSYGADGDFGIGTKNAVIAFQKAHGLVADGIIGRNTWSKLLGL